jgi:hypothetical protein
VASQINGVADLGQAGLLDVRDVGIGPDDLGSIVGVEALADAFA